MRPESTCPVEAALAAVSGRWTSLVLRDLMHGPRSFGQLSLGLPELSDKVLADRLSSLVDRGLVRRRVLAGFPSRTEYSLTDAGATLRPLLIELYRTGERLQELLGPEL
ncbi:helix-turn-helix domain-containing protein [Prescottella defluvii]|nr:helix-turn-helix domain-containing protein [Prescottella defluvii]